MDQDEGDMEVDDTTAAWKVSELIKYYSFLCLLIE